MSEAYTISVLESLTKIQDAYKQRENQDTEQEKIKNDEYVLAASLDALSLSSEFPLWQSIISDSIPQDTLSALPNGARIDFIAGNHPEKDSDGRKLGLFTINAGLKHMAVVTVTTDIDPNGSHTNVQAAWRTSGVFADNTHLAVDAIASYAIIKATNSVSQNI